jgi:hypothetical protein
MKLDANLWGQWPVSDRCKYYYYEVKKFIMEYVFPIESSIIELVTVTRKGAERWTVIP